ncbi:MAG: phenylalanine--tRNA ligase subunit beta [Myxococcaceae bacterium]
MKISLNWLSEYVELPKSDSGSGFNWQELASRLTMAGLEVEGIERPGEALKGVVVAQIISSDKHPDADKLSVTKVDTGGASPLQIVCGAKNYKVGDKVPLATPGTLLPGAKDAIKVGKLRGVDSFGMLCSARELGLSEDAAGLLILDPAAKPGEPIAQALGLDDVVFELNVTPNRPDALSHLGIAREVAALYAKMAKPPKPNLREGSAKAAESIGIRIEDQERCLRYSARVIDGVKVGPSPAWMQQRLKACGVRALSNVVDVTNYVLLEYGQPLHGFDLDQLGGHQIVVRTAKAGEKLTTLDGKERTLAADDLLICDREKPHVLAGVMGGAQSEVTDKTTRVLLEAATFQPSSIRRSSKRHQLHTESSHRFERGTDVGRLPEVLDRAAALIAEVAGGTVLQGVVDVYPKPKAAKKVTLRKGRTSELLGVSVPEADGERILTALGFKGAPAANGTEYEVPLARVDVSGEEDLIEEIARVRGFESIPPALPRTVPELSPEPASAVLERRVRTAMAGAGLTEVMNYSFVAEKDLAAINEEKGAIKIGNPLSEEQSVMRTSLLPSLVHNVSRAARHQAQGVGYYEIARSYRPDKEGAKGGEGARPGMHPIAVEVQQVAGVVWGAREGAVSWTAKDANADFFDAKAAVEKVLGVLHIDDARYEPLENDWYHPRAAATVWSGKTRLGTVGELHPRAAKRLDAPLGIYLFQLEMEALLACARLVPASATPSRFPAVLRDIAVVVPAALASEQVRGVILEVGAPLVEEARVFDVYTGKPLPEGQKNLAFALRYRAGDRTLTDQEVTAAHEKIVAEVNKRLGGSLRA